MQGVGFLRERKGGGGWFFLDGEGGREKGVFFI